MQPDVAQHNPAPQYLRELIARIGESQREVARRIGVSERTFRQYITDPDNKSYIIAPYVVQFALEQWASQCAEAH